MDSQSARDTAISCELAPGSDQPGYKLCALVNELVEGVLTIGPALTPDDRLTGISLISRKFNRTHSSLVIHSRAVLGDALPV